jgi:hypothetical protein
MRGGKRIGSGRKPDPSRISEGNHIRKCPECQKEISNKNKFCCKPCSATFYGRRRSEALKESRPDCHFCKKKCDRPDQKFCCQQCFYDSVKSETPLLEDVACDNCSTIFGRAKWTPHTSTCKNCRSERRKALNCSRAKSRYDNFSIEERKNHLSISSARRRKALRSIPNYFKAVNGGAKKRGFDVEITESDLIIQLIRQNGICTLSGRRISLLDSSASLDRVDSGIGYTKNNIQWIYKPLNTMKMDLPQSEFIQLCKEIAAYHT